MSDNDDIIPVESEKKESVETPIEPPVEVNTYSSPFSKIPSDYKHDNRTLNVPNEFNSDEELSKIVEEKTNEIEAQKPGDKAIENFIIALENLKEITANSFFGTNFAEYFKNKESQFTQKVTGDKGKAIRISNPVFTLPKSSGEMDGLNAIRFLSAATGVGHVMRIPLYHSGIVITIDAFKERKLLDLHQSIVRLNTDIGTYTKGLMYTADDVLMIKTIVEFILEHVIDTSMKNWNKDVQAIPEVLKSVILVNDIPSILAGALASIYPKGYPVFHQCINVIKGTCTYTLDAKRTPDLGDYEPDSLLDFRKVILVNNKRLSIEDKIHMTAVTPTYSLEEIKAYQKRVNYIPKYENGVSIYSNDKIEVLVNMKIATLDKYFESGIEWCTRITDMVDRIMLTDSTEGAEKRAELRNNLLNQYGSTVSLLRQTSWVDYLKINEKCEDKVYERRIVDPSTINNSLEVFGVVDGFEDNYNKAIQEFREDSIFVFSGISNFECPYCHSGQTDENSKHPALIPINLSTYFFILTAWRTRTKLE